jgi:hypothetical protein
MYHPEVVSSWRNRTSRVVIRLIDCLLFERNRTNASVLALLLQDRLHNLVLVVVIVCNKEGYRFL